MSDEEQEHFDVSMEQCPLCGNWYCLSWKTDSPEYDPENTHEYVYCDICGDVSEEFG